ncbi:twin-arginine translocase subunit TatC [Embleya sp. NBC_00896]|uniref:twin-arginine translocase subunit TatC n=1 Tax=Embleya sp. NBC_00896 TaxID=2975961 RepID=UPI00386A11EC|nr:twin-arginine translocase subunit TatC [Embleya sp. NBC_00896]
MLDKAGRGRESGSKQKKNKDAEGRMPLMEHLRELRNRLVKALLAIIVVTIVAAFYYKDIGAFLVEPACGLKNVKGTGSTDCELLVQSGALGPFSMMLKLSLVSGIIAASPIWLYQLWAFLAPGLHRHEKKYSLAFVGVGVPLFLGGAYFSYWILPHTLEVLLEFTLTDASNQIQLDEYLNFVVRMVVVFGLACELPLVLIMLNFGGVVTAKQLAGWWRWVVMGIFVFGAVATPTTDPITMILLSIPITVLYGVALIVAWINDRRRGRARAKALGGDLDDDEASVLDTGPAPVDAPSAVDPEPGREPGTRVDDIT